MVAEFSFVQYKRSRHIEHRWTIVYGLMGIISRTGWLVAYPSICFFSRVSFFPTLTHSPYTWVPQGPNFPSHTNAKRSPSPWLVWPPT